MPQMSPLKWLYLYFMFTLIFILFCIVNYYSFLPMTPQTTMEKKIKTYPLNWKW